ncbi:glycosyltransferase family 4 protein, partial [Meiothermus sp. PNK-Is4]
GTLEGVEEGKSGYLVAPRDSQGMAARALELLRDEDKRRKFSQAARHFADRRSARRIAEEIVACYDEASEILRAEPQRLIFPFPRLPRTET